MDLKTKYVVDQETIRNGVREQFDDTVFVLSYYNSTRAQLHFTNLVKQLKTQKILSDKDILIFAMRDTLAEEVVLNWENLKEDGKEIPFSINECKRILQEYDGLDVDLMNRSLKQGISKEAGKKETGEK